MMSRTLRLCIVVALAASCSKKTDDKAEPAPTGADKPAKPTAVAVTSTPDLPVDDNNKPTPPQGGTVIAKMQASQQKLDVDPPKTLGQHVSDTMAKIKATPKVECKAAGKGQWSCQVWPGDEFGYYYSGTFTWKDSWKLVDGTGAVSADD